jgi:hypothetical protein
MSVDALQNIMADYQFELTRTSGGPDLDPSDVYAAIFRKLGWSESEITSAIEDTDTSLEQRLLETTSPSVGYAKSLLRRGIEEVMEQLKQSDAAETAATANRP